MRVTDGEQIGYKHTVQVRGKRFLTRPELSVRFTSPPSPLSTPIPSTRPTLWRTTIMNYSQTQYAVVIRLSETFIIHPSDTSQARRSYFVFLHIIGIRVCSVCFSKSAVYFLRCCTSRTTGQLMTWPRPTHITYYIYTYTRWYSVQYSYHQLYYTLFTSAREHCVSNLPPRLIIHTHLMLFFSCIYHYYTAHRFQKYKWYT